MYPFPSLYFIVSMVARVDFQEILRDKLTNLFFFLSNGITIDETSRRRNFARITVINNRSFDEPLRVSFLLDLIYYYMIVNRKDIVQVI